MGAGYNDGRAFTNRQHLPVWLLCQGIVGCQFSRKTDSPLVRFMPLARDSGREVMMGSSCPFNSIA